MTNDFQRLEDKVDKLVEAVSKLVIVEERQSVMQTTIAALTERLTAAEKKLESWINRGMGVWALAVTGFTIWKSMKP